MIRSITGLVAVSADSLTVAGDISETAGNTTLANNITAVNGYFTNLYAGGVDITASSVAAHGNISITSAQVAALYGNVRLLQLADMSISGNVSLLQSTAASTYGNVLTQSGQISVLAGNISLVQNSAAATYGNVLAQSGQIGLLAGNISLLQNMAAATYGNTLAQSGQIGVLAGNISLLQGTAAATYGNVLAQSGQIGVLAGNITLLQNTAAATYGNVLAQSGQIGVVAGNISLVQNTAAATYGNVLAQSGQIGVLAGNITLLQNTAAATYGNVLAQSGQIGVLAGNITLLQNIAAATYGNTLTQSGQIGVLAGNITLLQNTAAATYGNVSTLQQGIFTGNVSVASTAQSISTNTGALRVSGGVGVLGNLYVAGTVWTQTGVRLNDSTIYLRTGGDNNHYLGFDYTNNGPVLAGFTGGSLGTTNQGIVSTLVWNRYTGVSIYGALSMGANPISTTGTVSTGPLNVTGTSQLFGAVNLGGNTLTTSGTTATGPLTVTGASKLYGAVSLGGNTLTTTGAVSTGALSAPSVSVSGDVSASNRIFMGGNLVLVASDLLPLSSNISSLQGTVNTHSSQIRILQDDAAAALTLATTADGGVTALGFTLAGVSTVATNAAGVAASATLLAEAAQGTADEALTMASNARYFVSTDLPHKTETCAADFNVRGLDGTSNVFSVNQDTTVVAHGQITADSLISLGSVTAASATVSGAAVCGSLNAGAGTLQTSAGSVLFNSWRVPGTLYQTSNGGIGNAAYWNYNRGAGGGHVFWNTNTQNSDFYIAAGNLIVQSTGAATSTATGAVRVSGGIGVAGTTFTGALTVTGATSLGTSLSFNGDLLANALNIRPTAFTDANCLSVLNRTTGDTTANGLLLGVTVPVALAATAYIDTKQNTVMSPVTPLSIRVNGTEVLNFDNSYIGKAAFRGTQDALSYNNAALTVAGGLGVGGNTYLNGNVFVGGPLILGGAVNVGTSISTLQLKTAALSCVSGASTFSGNLTCANFSTGPYTIFTSGNLYAGNIITAANAVVAGTLSVAGGVVGNIVFGGYISATAGFAGNVALTGAVAPAGGIIGNAITIATPDVNQANKLTIINQPLNGVNPTGIVVGVTVPTVGGYASTAYVSTPAANVGYSVTPLSLRVGGTESVFLDNTSLGKIYFRGTQAATSSITGAAIFAGGVGIAGSVYSAGSMSCTGALTAASVTAASLVGPNSTVSVGNYDAANLTATTNIQGGIINIGTDGAGVVNIGHDYGAVNIRCINTNPITIQGWMDQITYF